MANQIGYSFEEIKEKYISFVNGESFKAFSFNKEELLQLKIDISFINKNEEAREGNVSNFSGAPNTTDSVRWAKFQLNNFPQIKYLIQVLKRYLNIHNINSSFNGNNYLKVRWFIFLFPISNSSMLSEES